MMEQQILHSIRFWLMTKDIWVVFGGEGSRGIKDSYACNKLYCWLAVTIFPASSFPKCLLLRCLFCQDYVVQVIPLDLKYFGSYVISNANMVCQSYLGVC